MNPDRKTELSSNRNSEEDISERDVLPGGEAFHPMSSSTADRPENDLSPEKNAPAAHGEPSEDRETPAAKSVDVSAAAGINGQNGGRQTAFTFPNGFERYHDFRNLGAGGSGYVQSCTDTNLGRRVALKQLHAHLATDLVRQRELVREARMTARLDHPCVVPVYDLGIREDGSPYLTTKEVHGISLLDILAALKARDKSMERHYRLSRLLEIFQRVCEAVAFAHSRGVLHRDIKPDNILVGTYGEVHILDWGLAREISSLHNHRSKTATIPAEKIDGTVRYMSPEQVLGKTATLDERSDLYALGTILYEILTLQYSASGTTVEEIAEHIVNEMPKSPRKRTRHRRIPRELDAICMACLQKRREDRYASVMDLVRDLRQYAIQGKISVYRYNWFGRCWKWSRRNPVASVALAAAILTAICGFTASVFAGYVRGRTSFQHATRFQEEGDRIMNRCLALHGDISRLHRQSPVDLSAVQALENKIHLMESDFENQYEAALVLYAFAASACGLRPPPPPEHLAESASRWSALHRVSKANPVTVRVLGMFMNRISYAEMTEKHTEAVRLLKLLRAWTGPNFEEMAPDDREKFLQVDRLIQPSRNLPAETNETPVSP